MRLVPNLHLQYIPVANRCQQYIKIKHIFIYMSNVYTNIDNGWQWVYTTIVVLLLHYQFNHQTL
ncbi:hypothetical protein [Caudoviricetes sp.]|nr:hypothetical protein [Caudoviricetes sp.]